MSQKDLEKTWNVNDETRSKALQSPNHGKRGQGKATKFKALLQFAESADNQQSLIDLYNRAIAGEFGETVQSKLLLQTLDYQCNLERDEIKREADRDAKQHDHELRLSYLQEQTAYNHLMKQYTRTELEDLLTDEE